MQSLVLTERRAADREEMAAQLVAMARSLGAQTGVSHGIGHQRRSIAVSMQATGGLELVVVFSGASAQPGTYLVPWCVLGPKKLNPLFGSVNPHHFKKATHVVHGFDALMTEVQRGLQAAADGTAYQP